MNLIEWLKKLWQRFRGRLTGYYWKGHKPLTPVEQAYLKKNLNCSWGIFKKLGCVQKIPGPPRWGKFNKRIPTGQWFIGEPRLDVLQPTGMKRRKGETILQAFARYKKRKRG